MKYAILDEQIILRKDVRFENILMISHLFPSEFYFLNNFILLLVADVDVNVT
jgi:hypothetical protein